MERSVLSGRDIRLLLSASCLISLPTDSVAQLIPGAESPLYERVQQYRQLLDALPMDAYTHGCILHPELTTDSMIPKYATAEIRSKWPGCVWGWYPPVPDGESPKRIGVKLPVTFLLWLDSHSFACVCMSGHLANAATELMKLDHEEPQLTEPYLSKQKKLMVSLTSKPNPERDRAPAAQLLLLSAR